MKMTQFKQLIRKIIVEELQNYVDEYSDDQKQQMGIPRQAVARGGKWYVGDKYVGKTVNGKFVPAAEREKPTRALQYHPGNPKTPSKTKLSPDAQRERNKPKDSLAGDYYVPGDSSGEYEKGMESPSHVKVMNAVEDKFFAAGIRPNKTMSLDEFEKRTGIPRKAAQYYDKINKKYGSYDALFSYDKESDTITTNDLSNL